MSKAAEKLKIKGKLRSLDAALYPHQTIIDVNLDEMYGRTVAEMTLQQTKRDQIIASYLTVLSLAISVAMTGEQVTDPMIRGIFFLAAGVIGYLLAQVIIRYRVYKEAYWLCCQSMSVMFGYKKEALNKQVIQDIYKATMLKKGKGYTVKKCRWAAARELSVQLIDPRADGNGTPRLFELLDENKKLVQICTGSKYDFHFGCDVAALRKCEENRLQQHYTIRETGAGSQPKEYALTVTFALGKNGPEAAALVNDEAQPLKPDPELRFCRIKYVWKNLFSAETIYLLIQALISAAVTGLGVGFLAVNASWAQWRWWVALAVGVLVVLRLVWKYFAQCIGVYKWLIDGKDSSFNNAFGKAWLLHFYH